MAGVNKGKAWLGLLLGNLKELKSNESLLWGTVSLLLIQVPIFY